MAPCIAVRHFSLKVRGMDEIKRRIRPYMRALPIIFNYQIVTKVVLGVWLFLLGRMFQILLKSSGRVAVTSGDWMFLFTTWQGILILLLGIVSLFTYVTFDLNLKVVVSRNIVTGKIMPLKDALHEAFVSMGKLINVRGILFVVYIALAAPILGIGLSVTATKNFYIPTFISSVIKDTAIYSALAGGGSFLLLLIGIMNLFILHGVIIDKLPIREASKQSGRLIKANFWDYIKKNILFVVTISLIVCGAAIIFLFLPLKIISILPLSGAVSRVLTITFATAGVIFSALTDLFAVPMYMIKMTQLFLSYKQGEPYEYQEFTEDKHIRYKKALILVVIAVAVMITVTYHYFDQLFPQETSVKIIAHRAGGNEAPENTIAGLETAWRAGAYGSEIDIQRTKDGVYVINHDGTFKRVAGDSRKPEEMTLREVKKLSVKGEPVPTYEEMLLASRNHLVLFVELKGNTADRKMADEAVQMVKMYGMEDSVVIISLEYDLIDYIEKTYPEIQTGFLTFASFGNTAGLNCDYIALEEESATTDAIRNIHNEGKKALVWTANEKESQKHFLCSDVDGIITDNVTQAVELMTQLGNRSDIDRMVDKIKTIF